MRIRSRGTIRKTIYSKNKGLDAIIATNDDLFSKTELREISAKAVEFATKKITAEIVDEYQITDNAYESFNITSLTSQEKLLLSYLNFDPINPVPISDYTNIVGRAIQTSKLVTVTLMNQSGTGGGGTGGGGTGSGGTGGGTDGSGVQHDPSNCNYGISEETLDFIHNDLVTPHLEVSQMLGGSDGVVNNIIAEIEQALTNNPHCSKALRSFKDLMLVLKRGTTTYIDYVAEVRQKEEMTKMLQQFAFKISCLNDIIHKMIHGVDAFNAKASFKVNRPKPAIYAMAIFDLVDTWYRFLFPNQPIEREKYQSVKSYVESLGTETEGRAELYKLLDVVYKDPQDLLDNNELGNQQNPFAHYLHEFQQNQMNNPNNNYNPNNNQNHNHCNTNTNTNTNTCNTNTNYGNNQSNNTLNSDGIFITDGPFAGSLRFSGGITMQKNNLDNVAIDNTGNIIITKNNNNCSNCCCCPCTCSSHSQTQSTSHTSSQCYYDYNNSQNNSYNDLMFIQNGEFAGSVCFSGGISMCQNILSSSNINF
jgi:hypothetical protein